MGKAPDQGSEVCLMIEKSVIREVSVIVGGLVKLAENKVIRSRFCFLRPNHFMSLTRNNYWELEFTFVLVF